MSRVKVIRVDCGIAPDSRGLRCQKRGGSPQRQQLLLNLGGVFNARHVASHATLENLSLYLLRWLTANRPRHYMGTYSRKHGGIHLRDRAPDPLSQSYSRIFVWLTDMSHVVVAMFAQPKVSAQQGLECAGSRPRKTLTVICIRLSRAIGHHKANP